MTDPSAPQGTAGGDDLVPPGLDGTLVLVRHGETTWLREGRFQGSGDPPLTGRGERQAAAVADRLADAERAPALPVPIGPPLEIRSSPLRRALTTAQAIAARWPGGPAAVADPALRELGQGSWEGQRLADIAATDGERLAAWRRDPLAAWAPGGESPREGDARVRPVLRELLAALGDGRPPGSPDRPQVPGMPRDHRRDHPWSIVVAHDGLLKVALLALLDLPLERYWTFPFELCGVSVVEVFAGRPRLVAHNRVEHLTGLDPVTE
jgi:broad specificity phosphatase PhoE